MVSTRVEVQDMESEEGRKMQSLAGETSVLKVSRPWAVDMEASILGKGGKTERGGLQETGQLELRKKGGS